MTVVMHQCSNFNSVTGALALCITNDDDDDDCHSRKVYGISCKLMMQYIH